MKKFLPALLTVSFSLLASLLAEDAPKPLKVLLVTGGGFHDYAVQKDILKKGIEERANATVDIAFSPRGSKTKPEIPIYGNPEYATGYDVVIHDECAADITDVPIVEGVLKPHRDGIPGVNLHCAMHCYGKGNGGKPLEEGTAVAMWNEYIGLQSFGHGPQYPIKITYTDKSHPITKGFEDWTTIKEELYNSVKVFDTATPLANGQQTIEKTKKHADGTETVETKTLEYVTVWANLYMGKTRVFSTTIGHNNETVQDARYLDLVTRGLLWATGHLNDDGTPATGYGPKGK